MHNNPIAVHYLATARTLKAKFHALDAKGCNIHLISSVTIGFTAVYRHADRMFCLPFYLSVSAADIVWNVHTTRIRIYNSDIFPSLQSRFSDSRHTYTIAEYTFYIFVFATFVVLTVQQSLQFSILESLCWGLT